MQLPVNDARIVARANCVEAECERAIQHRRELDPLVTANARVGCATSGVLRDEVVDDVRTEALGHIPYVERHAEDVGGSPGVARVLQRAAAASPVSMRRR